MAKLKTLIRPLTAYIKGLYIKHISTQVSLRLCVMHTFDSVVFEELYRDPIKRYVINLIQDYRYVFHVNNKSNPPSDS